MSVRNNTNRKGGTGRRRIRNAAGSPNKSKKSFFNKAGELLSRYRLCVMISVGVIIIASLVLTALLAVIPALKKDAAVPVYEEPVVSFAADMQEDDPPEQTDEPQALAVGLILGSGDDAQQIMDGFGECAQELISSGSGLEKYYIYNAGEAGNQQIQDIRSLINRGCKAITAFGTDEYTDDIISRLCEEADIPVIGVEAEHNIFDVNITGGEAWFDGYSSSVKSSLAEGDTVLLVTDSEGSEFTREICSALSAQGVSLSETVYTSSKDYERELEDALGKAPSIIVSRGPEAAKVLFKAAQTGNIPRVFVTRATAGIISEWYELKNGGIVTVEAVIPKEGDTETEAVQEVRVASDGSLIFAYAGLDGTMLGRTACRFAYNYAMGGTASEDKIEFEVSSRKIITDSDINELYELVKDKPGESYVPGDVDFDAVDAYFEKEA